MNNKRWIFLRGLTRGNIHWAEFEDVFKLKVPDVEIEFLEIPGNGYLNEEKSPVSAKKLINLLRSNSNFVKNGEPFNLCGISLGGMAAMKWAEMYPQEVSSISIINSSLSQYSSFDKRLLPKNYEVLLKTLFLTNTFDQEENILKITSNFFDEKKKFVKIFADFSKEHQVTRMNFLRQLILARSIFIESIPLIPFKIISSQNDRLVDSTCSVMIAEKLGGVQFVHTTAGHDLPLDAPEWLSEILVKNL